MGGATFLPNNIIGRRQGLSPRERDNLYFANTPGRIVFRLEYRFIVLMQIARICISTLHRRLAERTDAMGAHGRRIQVRYCHRTPNQLRIPDFQHLPHSVSDARHHVPRSVQARTKLQQSRCRKSRFQLSTYTVIITVIPCPPPVCRTTAVQTGPVLPLPSERLTPAAPQLGRGS